MNPQLLSTTSCEGYYVFILLLIILTIKIIIIIMFLNILPPTSQPDQLITL